MAKKKNAKKSATKKEPGKKAPSPKGAPTTESAPKPKGKPYVARCPICEQGLIRLMQCSLCGDAAGICDECESAWSKSAVSDLAQRDPAAPSAKSTKKPEGAFPKCPACRAVAEWKFLTAEQIDQSGLASAVAGYSP